MADARKYATYSRAYSYGTDGSAALAGSPISSPRPLASPPKRRMRPEGVMAPRWLLLAIFGGILVLLLYQNGVINEQKSAITREMNFNGMELMSTQQRIVELDAALEVASSDETRIRSIALNRLGMQPPTADQIYYIPVPNVVEDQAQWGGQEKASGNSLFRLLMDAIGW